MSYEALHWYQLAKNQTTAYECLETLVNQSSHSLLKSDKIGPYAMAAIVILATHIACNLVETCSPRISRAINLSKELSPCRLVAKTLYLLTTRIAPIATLILFYLQGNSNLPSLNQLLDLMVHRDNCLDGDSDIQICHLTAPPYCVPPNATCQFIPCFINKEWQQNDPLDPNNDSSGALIFANSLPLLVYTIFYYATLAWLSCTSPTHDKERIHLLSIQGDEEEELFPPSELIPIVIQEGMEPLPTTIIQPPFTPKCLYITRLVSMLALSLFACASLFLLTKNQTIDSRYNPFLAFIRDLQNCSANCSFDPC